jgi:hypothetical protein
MVLHTMLKVSIGKSNNMRKADQNAGDYSDHPRTRIPAHKKRKKQQHQDQHKEDLSDVCALFRSRSVVTTVFNLPPEIKLCQGLSKFCIILAMSAIGLNTNIVKLVKKGASRSSWASAAGWESPW